jgi:acyl-CoA synthetase (AMP-forming)/AMP-acid ligase II
VIYNEEVVIQKPPLCARSFKATGDHQFYNSHCGVVVESRERDRGSEHDESERQTVSLARRPGADFSELITDRGTDPATRGRVFITNRADDGSLREYTYEQLYRGSLEYGNMIRRLRERRGKRGSERFHIGVFMQNRPEFFFILGGCAFTNSTLVGINSAQLGEKLAFDINNIDVDILIADDGAHPATKRSFTATALEAGERFGFGALTPEFMFSLGDDGGDLATVASLLEEHRSQAYRFAPEALRADQPAVIIFTSGTTGAPKGIEVTWDKLMDTGVTGTRILGYTEADVGYVCMPLNHSNSLYLNVMPALMNGARIMLRRRFSSSGFVKDLADSGATVWNSVGDPVHYVLSYLDQHYDRADFSHLPLRTVISTGANSSDRKAFTRIFGLDIFTEIYGSTEAGAVTAVDKGSPDYSVGKLIKDVRVLRQGACAAEAEDAVIDPAGRIENLGEAAGEVVVSQRSLGSSAFTGYYRLPGESAERLVSLDGEEFYRMGDLGAISRRGGEKYLVFLGRTGDWIRFKGENWSPVDAERIVIKHAGVRNVGVIGVPQSEGKEDDPMFVVEPTDPDRFDIEELCAYCARTLPHYMQPRFVRLKGSLPMTETMKVLKSRLKRDFIYRTPELDDDPEDVIFEIREGAASVFMTADYREEIRRYTDPTNRDRLTAFTGREDIFDD